jgi:hypothetical protein
MCKCLYISELNYALAKNTKRNPEKDVTVYDVAFPWKLLLLRYVVNINYKNVITIWKIHFCITNMKTLTFMKAE